MENLTSGAFLEITLHAKLIIIINICGLTWYNNDNDKNKISFWHNFTEGHGLNKVWRYVKQATQYNNCKNHNKKY